MAGPIVSVIVEGTDQLEELSQRIGDQTRALEAVGILARSEFKQNFVRQGRPVQWQRLSPGYEAEKRRAHSYGEIRGRNPRTMARVSDNTPGAGAIPGILIRTGAMMESYTRKGAKNNIHEIGADGRSLAVGSEDEKARWHEDGTLGGKVILPGKIGGVLAWYGIDPATGREGMVFRRKVVMKPLAKRQVVYLSPSAYDRISAIYEAYLAGEDPKSALQTGE